MTGTNPFQEIPEGSVCLVKYQMAESVEVGVVALYDSQQAGHSGHYDVTTIH